MSGRDGGCDEPEPCLVEDPESGERFLMYSLPIAAWPSAPRVVYECPACRERVSPEQWKGVCPSCSGKGRKKRRRDC